MYIYWIIGILAIFLNRVLSYNTRKEYAINLIISFIPFFIYGAIRVDYGADYPAYEMFFNIFHNASSFVPDKEHHAEIGYQFLCYIMPSFRSILVLNSFLLAAAFVVFIYKNIPSNYAWLAIFLIFLMPEKNIFGSLVGIRNGLVVSSFLITFTFVQQRKPILLVLTAMVLSTIHTSAIAYLPLAYLVARDTNITKKELYIWGGFGIVLMIASMSTLINFLLPIFQIIASRYEEALLDLQDGSRGMLNYFANFIMMIAFLIFGYKNNDELEPEQKSLIRMAALYCIAGCLGGISGRMTYYFAVYYIGGIVLMFSSNWQNKTLRYVFLGFVVLIACYATFYVWMGAEWWNHGTYHSLWGDF